MTHVFRFSIQPGLPPGSQSCFPPHIQILNGPPTPPGELSSHTPQLESEIEATSNQFSGESNEEFAERIQYEVERELLRLSVLTGRFYTARIMEVTPLLRRNINIQVATGWDHGEVDPRQAGGAQTWTGMLESKLMLWRRVSEDRADPMLAYAYLYMICELDSFNDWDIQSGQHPDAPQEIRLIRNLLLHSSQPNPSVIAYCALYGLSPGRSPSEVEQHKQHARDRLHALLADVWNALLQEVGVSD